MRIPLWKSTPIEHLECKGQGKAPPLQGGDGMLEPNQAIDIHGDKRSYDLLVDVSVSVSESGQILQSQV